MTAHDGYLPLSQDQDGGGPAYTPITSWWAARRAQATDFVSKNYGISLVILSELFFASMNLFVKLLGKLDPPTPTLEVVTIRMAITLCCCIIYMTINGVSDPFLGPKGVRGLLFARSLAGFVGIFAEYFALNSLPLADTTVLTFITPFVVALVGHLFLGETHTKKEALAAVCSLLGVVLIARPPFLFGGMGGGTGDTNITPFERLRAVGSTLISVGGQAMTFIVMRVIGPRAHPMQIMTVFSFWCVVVGSIAMAMTPESIVFSTDWKWVTLLLILGLLSVAGQYFLTLGLRYDTATRCALASYTQILFALVLELVVLGTVPSPSSAAGMVIIIAAQLFALLSKEKEPPSPPSSDNVEGSPLLS